jgi:hypothetical protein
MDELKVQETPGEETKGVKYRRRGMATVAGAPISWLALFGALMGVTSLVPMLFYIFGGGFISAGMAIFGPITGLVLGPWAGGIAGLVGGLIGMFLSPASYPLGLVDAFLSGAFLSLSWGLMIRKYSKFCIVWWVFWIIVVNVYPYYVPGAAGGFELPTQPGYFLSWSWTYLGLVLYLVLGLRFVPKWLEEGVSPTLMFLGLLLLNFFGNTCWMLPWKIIYFSILKFPADTVMADNTISWWAYTAPMVIAGTIVAQVTITAMRRGGLRQASGGLV